MIRLALVLAAGTLASTLAVSSASAQFPGAAAKRAAQSAAQATNAHIDAEQKGADQPVAQQSGAARPAQQGTAKPAVTKPAATKPAATKPVATTAAPTNKPAANKPAAKGAAAAATPGKGGQKPGLTIAARTDTATTVPPTIMREMFVYDAAGRRDPFVSLLTTSELRPALSDLKLTGILYDMSGRRPVATLRDLTDNTQYTVTTGTALGRMRVAAIRPKTVVFSIDEFGQNRLDSLVLGDSTKVRAR